MVMVCILKERGLSPVTSNINFPLRRHLSMYLTTVPCCSPANLWKNALAGLGIYGVCVPCFLLLLGLKLNCCQTLSYHNILQCTGSTLRIWFKSQKTWKGCQAPVWRQIWHSNPLVSYPFQGKKNSCLSQS